MPEQFVDAITGHQSTANDEFFVGWLKTPGGYVRFLRVVIPSVLVAVLFAAFLLTSQQRSPGSGEWREDEVVTLEGVASVEPYPLVRIPGDNSSEPVRTVLLVSEGKFGAAERMRPFDGQAVRVTGTVLHRVDRWMLELASQSDAIQATPGMKLERQRDLQPHERPLGTVSLRGEIIDAKCYLGAMKPGGGKTHKACAALCISGGIPPMFVTRDAERRETFYLLVDPEGRAINDAILPFVGDPIELTGELVLRADQRVLRIDVRNISRL